MCAVKASTVPLDILGAALSLPIHMPMPKTVASRGSRYGTRLPQISAAVDDCITTPTVFPSVDDRNSHQYPCALTDVRSQPLRLIDFCHPFLHIAFALLYSDCGELSNRTDSLHLYSAACRLSYFKVHPSVYIFAALFDIRTVSYCAHIRNHAQGQYSCGRISPRRTWLALR